MNRYLLDTNVVSELRKTKPHGAVVAWLRDLRDEQIFLSAVTLGELQIGVELVRRHDSAKAAEIDAWLNQVEVCYEILPLDGRCFRESGRLMAGKPDDLLEDALIAATARIHDLAVATRNERDFLPFEVRVVNPFTAK